jgi:hypothetical protein
MKREITMVFQYDSDHDIGADINNAEAAIRSSFHRHKDNDETNPPILPKIRSVVVKSI